MAENQKIRFKFPSGEEFEAEGSLEFIETQRNYFLALLEKQKAAPASAVQTPAPQPQNNPETALGRAYNPHLWEDLLRQDDNLVFLRKKHKISAAQAVFLLLAGAKMLLNKDACSALELSRALKLSGIETGRLDRLLRGEISTGRLQAAGAKRSRLYQLSPTGLAYASVLAEKLD